MSDLDVVFLDDDGQSAQSVLDRLIAFIAQAQSSLDLAVYDAHLPDAMADALIAALDAAEARNVRVRAVYNDEHRDTGRLPPPTGPSSLRRIAAAVPSTAIPGTPDLMHHKYIVRDRSAVWTGSANWTQDAWTHMENVIVTVSSADVAAAFSSDFEELWQGHAVEGTGTINDQPARLAFGDDDDVFVRALFSPARGRELGMTIAGAIGRARRRVRICSPVLTSGPILSAMAELLDEHRCDASVTVDGPQMQGALRQWAQDGRSRWKGPLFERVRHAGVLAEKHSRAFEAGPPHNYMHAKIVVADDVVFTGSYNCSRSGERNAENVLEIRSAALADVFAAYCERIHAKYAAQ